jgi:hypothetical protein
VLNDEHVSVTPVEATVDEKEHTILVQCPDWIRYNPQSYKAPPKLELTPPPKEETKPPRPTMRVVTSDADDDKEVVLNRKQRRLAANVLARAMK